MSNLSLFRDKVRNCYSTIAKRQKRKEQVPLWCGLHFTIRSPALKPHDLGEWPAPLATIIWIRFCPAYTFLKLSRFAGVSDASAAS
jgi:hypothetical protein